jgi:CheY-like chemotaxis protein
MTQSSRRTRARLLVVDDQVALRQSLACLLGEEYVVETAGSMSEALDRLRSGATFDLILSDVTMPCGSGADLHDSLVREFPACARRVVFMTGGMTDPVRARIERLPNVCLDKPIDVGRLHAVVRRSVGEVGASASHADCTSSSAPPDEDPGAPSDIPTIL